MQRLVYAPKVNAWVKTDSGVVDLSPFIVSGSVNRKVNEVSTAELTIRNPKVNDRMIFTENYRKETKTVEPLLHPMDPIVITLTRLNDRPIQVFTGYCDSTPYLQLYAGTATIRASCTLKRLMHTYWDPGLPFTRDFLGKYGWFPNQAAGGISNPTTDPGKVLTNVQSFNDGSIGNLLLAVLRDIGGWDESTIYIEALPNTIGPLVANLYQQFQAGVKETRAVQEKFQDLLTQLIGPLTYGSGGNPAGSSGNGTDPTSGHGKGAISLSTFNSYAQPAAKKYGIRPSILFAICEVETNFGANRGPSNKGALGLMQFEPQTAKGYGIDPFDDKQAVFGAAHLLHDNGAPGDYSAAVHSYNPGSSTYTGDVLSREHKYFRYNH